MEFHMLFFNVHRMPVHLPVHRMLMQFNRRTQVGLAHVECGHRRIGAILQRGT